MRLTFLFLILLYSMTWAQVYMNIKNKDGTTQSFNIEEVRKLTFTGVVGVEQGPLVSNALKTFTLLQNYPNPFNPSTTIEYSIPNSGNVEVKIFNISGQVVKTIDNSFKNAGSYKVTWNSKNDFGNKVATGVYLFQVKYEKSFLTKKIMLIK